MAILNDSGTVDTRPTVVQVFAPNKKTTTKPKPKPKPKPAPKPVVSDSWMRVTNPATFKVSGGTSSTKPPASNSKTGSRGGSGSSSSSSAKVSTGFPSVPPKVSSTGGSSSGGGTALSWNPRSAADRAATAANTEFDPQISAVAALIKQMQEMTERNKAELGSMYGALSQSINNDLPVIAQQYGQTKSDITNLYDQLRGTITGNYDKARQDQMAEFERLGIQAAAPDAFKQQDADKNFLSNLAGIINQGTQNVLNVQQKGTEDFTRSNAHLSDAEGKNRISDLLDQLSDRQFTLGQQQNSLIGAKASAQRQFQDQFEQQDFNNNMTLAQFNAQQEQSKREFDAQQQQQLFNNQITLKQMQQNQAQFDQQMQLQRQEFSWKKVIDAAGSGGSGADTTKMDPIQKAIFSLSQYGSIGEGNAPTVAGLIQEVMQGDPAALNGFYYDNTHKDAYGNPIKQTVTPQYFANLVKNKVASTGRYSNFADPAYQVALQLWIDMQAKRGA